MNERQLKALPKAKPRFIEPMYAKPVQALPESNEWMYEIKLDGYRCLAARNGNGITLWSRRGTLLAKQFPTVARACERLEPDTLIDGEVVGRDETGRISFSALQHYRAAVHSVQYYAFDLLIYRGRSLLNVPLQVRRELLGAALRPALSTDQIRLSETFSAAARDLIRAGTELGLEGIVAKQTGSLYESGKRTGAWVKYKINRSQEFVIGGYTTGNPFDGLIVGYYQNDKLLFAAKVRNGFVARVRHEVAPRLKNLATDSCPFANLPEKKRTPWALTAEEMKKCRWLRPELVAQVEFTEWTPDNHLRQAAFVGLRFDKDPREVFKEE
ncbi:MAG: non-homologous end-joining DNA ligase [Candidatus Binatia bacterium]